MPETTEVGTYSSCIRRCARLFATKFAKTVSVEFHARGLTLFQYGDYADPKCPQR
jgi:hypothetical protein